MLHFFSVNILNFFFSIFAPAFNEYLQYRPAYNLKGKPADARHTALFLIKIAYVKTMISHRGLHFMQHTHIQIDIKEKQLNTTTKQFYGKRD